MHRRDMATTESCRGVADAAVRGAVEGAVVLVGEEADRVDVHALGDRFPGGQHPAPGVGVGEAVEHGGDVAVGAAVEDEREVVRTYSP